jgi:CubicO group peptidase (beta-lactamase class C family)
MPIRLKKSCYIKGILFVFTYLTGQTMNAQIIRDSIDVYLEEKMKILQIPGLQLAVIKQGQVVKLSSYGLANIEHEIPMDEQSVISIYSITQAFASVAVMQLEEEGKLNLTDPLSKYLDNLPAEWNTITIKQALSHTSGLPEMKNPNDLVRAGGMEDVNLTEMDNLALEFRPGEQFRHRAMGYVLLGQMINQITKRHFTGFIQQRQFQLVGMKQTRFGDTYDIVPHMAGSYTNLRRIDGEWIKTDQLRNTFIEFPVFYRSSTGIMSTAKELADWVIALQAGKLLRKKESLQTLWSPVLMKNGKPDGPSNLLNGYGLGWPIAYRAEHPAIGPIGDRSAIFIYPKDDLAIVILTNKQGAKPEKFIDEVAGYYIPSMKASTGFGLPASVKTLRAALLKTGFDQVYKVLKDLRKKDPGFKLEEDELNDWGYLLLSQGKNREALTIFQLNVHLYPTSSNTYDSVAEAYARNGDKNAAIKNYKRSLELDPENKNAIEQLKILNADL